MWLLALLALASAASAADQNLTVDGEVFGPRRTLTCKWFTNFENSRFSQCRDATGLVFQEGESASILCARDNCSRLDAEGVKAAGSKAGGTPSGVFTVELVGRASLRPHPPRFLGDGTETVFVEEVTSVRVSN